MKCKETKELIQNLNQKPMGITESGTKNQINQPKHDIRKIDEEKQQLYGLVKKATEKLGN